MRLGIGVGLVIALLFLPRPGHAHTPGLSMAELAVDAQGRVEARLTFASAEPLRGLPLRQEDLRAFVLDGVDVAADGERCDPSYGGGSLTDGDGLLLEATYACPAGAREIALTLYYLNDLPRGHRVIARIVGPPNGAARAEDVLSADRRGLALELCDTTASKWGKRAWWAGRWRMALAVTVALALLVLALLGWRRLSRERRHETRAPTVSPGDLSKVD
jgi:hypothetical protein